MLTGIIVAALVVGCVGIILGFFLGISGEKFKVEVDPREEAILEVLPGNNCGGCGYAGCSGLAAAIAKGEAPVGQCPVGGDPVAAKVGEIMGVSAGASVKKVAFVKCAGTCEKAKQDYPISDDLMEKMQKLDSYLITRFKLSFGNRIVKHMRKFVPVYVGCGGDEIEAVDYFMAKKVLRKFEALNLALIRDEIDGYIEFLDKNFGKGKMNECIEFLLRLKKMS